MKILVLVLLVFCVGCSSSDFGMNHKMATADSVSGISAVVALNRVDDDKFESSKEQIVETCIDLIAFLDSGSLSELPMIEIEEALEKYLATTKYSSFDFVIKYAVEGVSRFNVDVDKIGTDNIKLIKIGLEEIIRNVNRCTKEGK